MAIRTDEAFVLKRMPFRETSLLVTLFTREAGKIKTLAKGVRKPPKATTGSFEPLTRLSIVYYEKLKSEIHLLSKADILETNARIRDRLDGFSYGSYLAELVDALMVSTDPHPEVFDLFGCALQYFQPGMAVRAAHVFQVKLLELIGWLPEFNRCASCGTQELARHFFSSKQGGVLCPACDRNESRAIPLSAETVDTFLFFLGVPFEQAIRLVPAEKTIRELDRAMSEFLQFRLEHYLLSSRFLSEVRPILQLK